VNKNTAAVVIEFKHLKTEPENLKVEAQKALDQIEEKVYIHNLKVEGYEQIYKYGIAFHKKTCEVVMGSMGKGSMRATAY